MVAHAGHRRCGQPPALAQRGAERVVADAEAGALERDQLEVAGRRAQHRAVVVGRVPEQHGLAAFLEQAGRMRGPGVDAELLREPAHAQAAQRGAAPDRLELGGRRKRRAQSHLEGHRSDLAQAEVGQGLLHRLHAPAQTVQRRADRLEHRGGQRHVGLDQRRGGLQVDLVLGQQQRQPHQRIGLGGDVDVEAAQFGVHGHGSSRGRQGSGSHRSRGRRRRDQRKKAL